MADDFKRAAPYNLGDFDHLGKVGRVRKHWHKRAARQALKRELSAGAIKDDMPVYACDMGTCDYCDAVS